MGPHLFLENSAGGEEQIIQDAKAIHTLKKKVQNKKGVRAKSDF